MERSNLEEQLVRELLSANTLGKMAVPLIKVLPVCRPQIIRQHTMLPLDPMGFDDHFELARNDGNEDTQGWRAYMMKYRHCFVHLIYINTFRKRQKLLAISSQKLPLQNRVKTPGTSGPPRSSGIQCLTARLPRAYARIHRNSCLSRVKGIQSGRSCWTETGRNTYIYSCADAQFLRNCKPRLQKTLRESCQ